MRSQGNFGGMGGCGEGVTVEDGRGGTEGGFGAAVDGEGKSRCKRRKKTVGENIVSQRTVNAFNCITELGKKDTLT